MPLTVVNTSSGVSVCKLGDNFTQGVVGFAGMGQYFVSLALHLLFNGDKVNEDKSAGGSAIQRAESDFALVTDLVQFRLNGVFKQIFIHFQNVLAYPLAHCSSSTAHNIKLLEIRLRLRENVLGIDLDLDVVIKHLEARNCSIEFLQRYKFNRISRAISSNTFLPRSVGLTQKFEVTSSAETSLESQITTLFTPVRITFLTNSPVIEVKLSTRKQDFFNLEIKRLRLNSSWSLCIP